MNDPARSRLLVAGATVTTAALVAAPTVPAAGAPAREPAAAATAVVAGAFDPAPAGAAIERLVGVADDLRLVALDRGDGADRYRVTAADGAVQVAATSPATMVKGFHAYLGEELDMSVSWDVDNLGGTVADPAPDLPAELPLPSAPIEAESNVGHRYYGNDTEDGYTGPYRTWEDWEREIDVLAAQGVNEVFVPVGTEAVYLDVMTRFGYSRQEILEWIPQPGHQPWWLLQNMASTSEPVTAALVADRAALGRRIADRLRELGMTPVLPGYFGTVPPGFAERNPGAQVVPQGGWVGYERPDWLSPAGPVYPEVAAAFYESSERILGRSSMYKMDLLHEGGQAGGVDVGAATRAVEDALQAARPGATWVLLGWQNNPPSSVLRAVDPATTLVVDGLSDRYPLDREQSWQGVPYAFGSIWNFGGHTTLGAQLSLWNTRYFEWLAASGSAMRGVAIMPEGGHNNPVALDFLASRAWATGPVDLAQWFERWSQRRYGTQDAAAAAAWDVLRRTVYDLPTDDGWSEAQDGLYGAVPSLTASNAATWSPGTARYDLDAFAEALPLLLDAGSAASETPTYAYDLMSVARQVLSNTSRTLLPQLAQADAAGDAERFRALADEWLANIDLLDAVVGTQPSHLLGRWVEQARAAAFTPQEADVLEADALTLLTTWGGRPAAEAGLTDYANREWQGLVGTYYKGRWARFLDARHEAIVTGEPAPDVDWYQVGADFVRDHPAFPTRPSGDVVVLAREVVRRHEAAQRPLPDPPGAGVTFLSDLPFADVSTNPAYGPVERDTEIGEAAAGDGAPIRVAGVEYAKGIGVNSPTEIAFNLAGRCTTLTAVAGIDDVMDKPDAYPSVVFRVRGDGVILDESGVMRAGEALELSVDVTGVDVLTLEVDPAAEATLPGHGDEWWDRADWADAAVTCGGPGPELPVDVAARTRCLAGGAVVAVRATNEGTAPVSVRIVTPFGERTVGDVAPDGSAYQSFTAGARAVGAGTARVEATGTVDGRVVTETIDAPYGARSCAEE